MGELLFLNDEEKLTRIILKLNEQIMNLHPNSHEARILEARVQVLMKRTELLREWRKKHA